MDGRATLTMDTSSMTTSWAETSSARTARRRERRAGSGSLSGRERVVIGCSVGASSGRSGDSGYGRRARGPGRTSRGCGPGSCGCGPGRGPCRSGAWHSCSSPLDGRTVDVLTVLRSSAGRAGRMAGMWSGEDDGDLAADLRLLELPHGVRRLLQRVGAVECRISLAGLDEAVEPLVVGGRAPSWPAARAAARRRVRGSTPRICRPIPVMAPASSPPTKTAVPRG